MNSIKVQIISDLHLGKDRRTIDVRPCADYLLIGGDVDEYTTGFKFLKKFLMKVKPLYKKVVWIMGNHEVMASSRSLKTYNDIVKICIKLAAKTGTIFLHDNSCELTKGLVVIGSPLFSHIPEGFAERTKKNPFPRGMKMRVDNKRIPKQIDREHINRLHEHAKSAIIRELDKCSKNGSKAIVMTHYGPLAPGGTRSERDLTFKQNEKELGHYNTDDDMKEVLEKCKDVVPLWTFGHCHTNKKFRYISEDNSDGESTWGFDIVSNQLGHYNKPFKGTPFDSEYTYTITSKY